MPMLADRWRLVAPDFPGFGYSGTLHPSAFGYDFGAYAGFLGAFADRLGLSRYVLWLHDYGSQIGLRDLPDADLQLLPDAGHWLLETLSEAVGLTRSFLERHHLNPVGS